MLNKNKVISCSNGNAIVKCPICGFEYMVNIKKIKTEKCLHCNTDIKDYRIGHTNNADL